MLREMRRDLKVSMSRVSEPMRSLTSSVSALIITGVVSIVASGCLPDAKLSDPDLPNEFSQVIPSVRSRGDATPAPDLPDGDLDMSMELDQDLSSPDMTPDMTLPDIGPPRLITRALYFTGDHAERVSSGDVQVYGHLTWWGIPLERK